MSSATIMASAEKFVDYLRSRVIIDATGQEASRIQTLPSGTFWLGRLGAEATIARTIDSRGDRLDPCSMGFRFQTNAEFPITLRVSVKAHVWVKEDTTNWIKRGPLSEELSVVIESPTGIRSYGNRELSSALSSISGTSGLRARLDVEASQLRQGLTELILTLVNCSDDSPPLDDNHLYECSLAVSDARIIPYQLEALPDSFRYDREIPAYGLNCGAVWDRHSSTLMSCDDPVADKHRPRFWPENITEPKFSFLALADDPLTLPQSLYDAVVQWGNANWSDAVLAERKIAENWTEAIAANASHSANAFWDECSRLKKGIDSLRADPVLARSFQYMNKAMSISAQGKYDAWRPFQLGFLLANLYGLVESGHDADVVDIVWFATGGGKTETYLGLLVTAAFHDRLTGKLAGITAWSRFPLRMLSLQQTQRFANALAGAELVRRQERIPGSPFSMGFLVGAGATPNSLSPEPGPGDPDPDNDDMPKQFRLLEKCPFCRQPSIEMAFDHVTWTLQHRCTNQHCSWPEKELPLYVVDDEIYRFLPTVVVGTLDKAANLGMQASMRGFVGAPQGLCSEPGHGHVYAIRSKRPNGCLVPGCRGRRTTLPQDTSLYAPSFRLQDELHLLRDSLGAVNSHYEGLIDSLTTTLSGRKQKILASSATLAGYEKQVDVLYQRHARVFPQPSPTPSSGFWSSDTEFLMRRYSAIAPRGVTTEHATDRILTVLQREIREFARDPDPICNSLGIPIAHASELISLYGTNVVYGNNLRDLDAVVRSIEGQQVRVEGLQVASLTGRTGFEEVSQTLRRLEGPEIDFKDRIHIVVASSMMSHGVDIDRLNVMVMIGLPMATAEFIQTTARVGRTWPGLVFVLHKIGRERDASVYRTFEKYVQHGDRFVEPIPITRRSRRVLERTLPGILQSRILHLYEPGVTGGLTTVQKLRTFDASGGRVIEDELLAIEELLGLSGGLDEPVKKELEDWFARYRRLIANPPAGVKFPSELYPGQLGPMRSLRDVEEAVPIYGREEQ